MIAGATVPLQPRLLLSTKIREARVPVAARASKKARPKRKTKKAKRIKVNRITVSGRLTLPGTPWPSTLLTVLLPRKGKSPKAVPVVVKEGVFWARFEGRDLRSGTIEVRYAGSDAYHPLTTQLQVVSSVTTSR